MSIFAETPPVHTITPPTPCIGVCEMDGNTGLCRGCARSTEEITIWQNAENAEKSAIWELLGERRAGLGLHVNRLPWSADDIYAMVERSLRRRWGRWVLGTGNASAGFEILPDADADIISSNDAVSAITAYGAIRLERHEKTIAVAFGSAANECGPDAIGLILPRGRLRLRSNDVITNVGDDNNAIAISQSGASLFDLGLEAQSTARFCLRSSDPSAIAALSSFAGRTLGDLARSDYDLLSGTSVHSIVEAGLGRIEAFSRPRLGDAIHAGDQAGVTSLEPVPILPEEWPVKSVFAICAVFYPAYRRPVNAFLDGPF